MWEAAFELISTGGAVGSHGTSMNGASDVLKDVLQDLSSASH